MYEPGQYPNVLTTRVFGAKQDYDKFKDYDEYEDKYPIYMSSPCIKTHDNEVICAGKFNSIGVKKIFRNIMTRCKKS